MMKSAIRPNRPNNSASFSVERSQQEQHCSGMPRIQQPRRCGSAAKFFQWFAWHVFVSRWAIAPVTDWLVVLESGAIALRLKSRSPDHGNQTVGSSFAIALILSQSRNISVSGHRSESANHQRTSRDFAPTMADANTSAGVLKPKYHTASGAAIDSPRNNN